MFAHGTLGGREVGAVLRRCALVLPVRRWRADGTCPSRALDWARRFQYRLDRECSRDPGGAHVCAAALGRQVMAALTEAVAGRLARGEAPRARLGDALARWTGDLDLPDRGHTGVGCFDPGNNARPEPFPQIRGSTTAGVGPGRCWARHVAPGLGRAGLYPRARLGAQLRPGRLLLAVGTSVPRSARRRARRRRCTCLAREKRRGSPRRRGAPDGTWRSRIADRPAHPAGGAPRRDPRTSPATPAGHRVHRDLRDGSEPPLILHPGHRPARSGPAVPQQAAAATPPAGQLRDLLREPAHPPRAGAPGTPVEPRRRTARDLRQLCCHQATAPDQTRSSRAGTDPARISSPALRDTTPRPAISDSGCSRLTRSTPRTGRPDHSDHLIARN